MSDAPRAGSHGIDVLVQQLPRLTLVVGKGGVGKTTCAAGLAGAIAKPGTRTLLLSTDPAAILADAIGVPLNASAATRVPEYDALDARQLSAADARSVFLERWRDVIVSIIDRGTYLDLDDVRGLVDAAFPGADEIFALLALAELVFGEEYERIIVDTAPTGHTLRLLALPETFDAMISLLDAMQAKHRFMVTALTHQYRRDQADAFIGEMRRTIGALRDMLTDESRCAAVLVTRLEPVVLAETTRFLDALRGMGIAVAAIVVNAVPEPLSASEQALLLEITAVADRLPVYELPRLPESPMGLRSIERAMKHLAPVRSNMVGSGRSMRTERKGSRTARVGGASSHLGGAPRARHIDLSAFVRVLTLTGGKGGVGKTTVSCALALSAATALGGRGRVLLVSTDPAPSIADALDQPIDDTECEVARAPGLFARQMDASAAFRAFRERYQERIDALFDGLIGHGLDASHDRGILRELLALAPPGIDELYALASLGDTLEQGDYDRIVVDPAPTGHLIRLLEMPALALEWSHRLMRLMLKYKEVAGLGDSAQELLAFAKRTRAIDALLHSPERAGLVMVALDEPLVRAESARLVRTLRAAGIAVLAVAWNRADAAETRRPLPLPTDVPLPQVVAPLATPSLIGVDAIRAWSKQWYALSPGAV